MLQTKEVTFTKIDARALADLAPYFQGKWAGICDMTVLYLHMWGALLGMEYAIVSDTLLLRRCRRGQYSYYPPLILGEDPACRLGLASLHLLGDAAELTLCALPQQALENLKELYTVSDIATTRDYADYIYSAEDLATLSGKRFSKKRNLVHQFEKLYPSHTYEPLTAENLAEVMALAELVKEEHTDDRDKTYENARVLDVLRDYTKLPLTGGVLRVNGEVAAFCVGELIDDTLYVHIEKADRRYKGAYQYINRSYVRAMRELQPFAYVNREDDAGDEGLRQAKLSYNPLSLAYKYRAVVKIKE